jgi:hypothetical protein
MVARFRAFGHSMEPVIPSGSVLTIEPVDIERLMLGDIVVVRVGKSTMTHLVKAIDAERRKLEISGTGGRANGWTTFDCVYAICTRVGGRPVPGVQARARKLGLDRLRNGLRRLGLF